MRGRSSAFDAEERHFEVYADHPAAKGLHHRFDDVGMSSNSRWASCRAWLRQLAIKIDSPVHCSTMAVYRMLYAICVLAQLLKWDKMFVKFSESATVFPYTGYGWVKPLDPAHGRQLISVCWWASLCQLVGLATPLATGTAGLTFTWLFLICESNFNNHYTLMCHMLLLGTFIGWGRSFSLDRFIANVNGWRLEPFAPAWNLMLIRIIVIIPYFFGGIAKLNSDWLLRKQPVTMWFEKKGWPYDWDLFQWFICWTGMIFDLVQPFLLFNHRTRYTLAFPGALIFNCSNKIMFNIGVFPPMMIASLVLFLEPYVPAQAYEWVMQITQKDPLALKEKITPGPKEASETAVKQWRAAGQGLGTSSHVLSSRAVFGASARQVLGLIFVSGFLFFHGLYPLRHFVLYPGNPSWHEEGHNGAWHMKLRTKEGHTHLILTDSKGIVRQIDPAADPYLCKQQRKLFSKPHAIILYVGRLKQVFEAAGNPLQSVTASDCFSLNRRSYRHLHVRGVNLLAFVGRYELLGVSAARQVEGHPDKWLWQDGEGPRCIRNEHMVDHPNTTAIGASTRRYLKDVYHQAGIVRWSQEVARRNIPNYWKLKTGDKRFPVVRVDREGNFLEFAYAWDNGL